MKVPLYARAELPQVWLVDVERRVLHVHRDPVDSAYADITTLHTGATVRTGGPLDLELYVSSILG